MLSLSGDNPITTGFFIDSLFMTQSRVSLVAIAVKAKIFTQHGRRLLMVPSSLNALQNVSPLKSEIS